MKQTVVLIACCLFYFSCLSQQVFQLAPPLMKYVSIFFKKSMAVELQFREPGATIRYTLDNTEPTEKSKLYTKPVIISTNKTTLKAKSFSKKYAASEPVANTFIQSGISIKAIDCTPPNEKYTGTGANALIDNNGGNPSGSSKTWLGFQNDTVTIELTLQQPQSIKEVLIDFLHAEGGWIFMPEKIAVYIFNETTKTWQAFNQKIFSFDAATPGSNCEYTSIEGQPAKTGKVLVKIMPLQNIPGWHDGKGKHAWVFIDEIKVY
jgi:Chitobiase/beta-hexosaminidase C-terminal domain